MLRETWADAKSVLRGQLVDMGWIVAAWAAAVVAFAFIVAALLVYVGSMFGPIAACVVGATFFAVVAIILFVVSSSFHRAEEQRKHERAAKLKSAVQSKLALPGMALAGVKLVKSVPTWVLAVGLAAVAVGYMSTGRRKAGA